MKDIRERIVNSALELHRAEAALKDSRNAFTRLKRDHNGEGVCFAYPTSADQGEPCEACKDFQSRYDHKRLLKKRAMAKRKLLTACSRLGERPEGTDAQPKGGAAK